MNFSEVPKDAPAKSLRRNRGWPCTQCKKSFVNVRALEDHLCTKRLIKEEYNNEDTDSADEGVHLIDQV